MNNIDETMNVQKEEDNQGKMECAKPIRRITLLHIEPGMFADVLANTLNQELINVSSNSVTLSDLDFTVASIPDVEVEETPTQTEADNRIKALTERLEHYTSQLSDVETETKCLTEKFENSRSKAMDEIKEIQDKISKAQDVLNKAQIEQTKLQKERDNLKLELEELKEDFVEMRQNLLRTQAEAKAFERQSSDLQFKSNQSQLDSIRLTAELNVLERECTNLNDVVNLIRRKLEEETQNRLELEYSNQHLREDMSSREQWYEQQIQSLKRKRSSEEEALQTTAKQPKVGCSRCSLKSTVTTENASEACADEECVKYVPLGSVTDFQNWFLSTAVNAFLINPEALAENADTLQQQNSLIPHEQHENENEERCIIM